MQVTPRDVKGWKVSLMKKGLKPRSSQLKLSALKSFYAFLLEEEILDYDPKVVV